MQTCIALIDKDPLLHPVAHKGESSEAPPRRKRQKTAEKADLTFFFLKRTIPDKQFLQLLFSHLSKH